MGELADEWFRALDALSLHSAEPDAGGHTPSDFPLVTLTQQEMDDLVVARPDLADVHALAPLQEGLLVHSGPGADTYTLQVILDVAGDVDVTALQAAGQALLERYPNLRAAVHRTSQDRPVAVIPQQARLPWELADLSGRDQATLPDEAARLLAEDRARPFDLARPPLLRMLLVRLGAGQHRLGITFHRILVDGWSIPLLVRELSELCAGRGSTTGLAPAVPYRDYLAWLAAQDRPAAEDAWQQALAGLRAPTPIAGADQQHHPTSDHATRALP